jgi:MFS family permease
MGLLFLCSTLPAYAFAYFLALILNGFGYSIRDSQLLSAPPYVCAIIFGMIVGFTADKIKMRGPFIILGALISATGSLVVGYAKGNGARYFGAFLAVMGCQSNIPTVMSWSVNNVRGYGARAISSAIVYVIFARSIQKLIRADDIGLREEVSEVSSLVSLSDNRIEQPDTFPGCGLRSLLRLPSVLSPHF